MIVESSSGNKIKEKGMMPRNRIEVEVAGQFYCF